MALPLWAPQRLLFLRGTRGAGFVPFHPCFAQLPAHPWAPRAGQQLDTAATWELRGAEAPPGHLRWCLKQSHLPAVGKFLTLALLDGLLSF